MLRKYFKSMNHLFNYRNMFMSCMIKDNPDEQVRQNNNYLSEHFILQLTKQED